ncbi:GNAT family N-acetyltransferase [Calothrix sp. 336/3]|uniref:GNAT family N-acetyltransferase n=1 Tax=Calothrix sp. 336/3 TaxID=1337936 RepID=UPI0004E294C2|nr:GNAT family N-acetyltransferase [Calothrix sp. 336/3]AKG19951.1 acetyltransferase [Calothrix sp. 336/3]
MIRAIAPDDTTALLALAEATGLFQPENIEELAQILAAHFDDASDSSGIWLTDDDNDLVAIAYFAPERMTEGTWNLYLIAIHPKYQRQGRGAALLAHIEKMLIEQGERILLVETSGLEGFDYVRDFYRKNGFEEEARIRDFYQAGDDKIVFRKVLKV